MPLCPTQGRAAVAVAFGPPQRGFAARPFLGVQRVQDAPPSPLGGEQPVLVPAPAFLPGRSRGIVVVLRFSL
jgi:hypothetical protein